MFSGSEAGSYLKLIDLVYRSTLGLGKIKKKTEWVDLVFPRGLVEGSRELLGFRVMRLKLVKQLVVKAHGLCVSLNSRLGSTKEEGWWNLDGRGGHELVPERALVQLVPFGVQLSGQHVRA